MRLFHTGDLHIGKRPGNRSLADDLREVMLGQILGAAYEKYRPDGLMIAGDIYDRSMPPSDAVALFDEILSRAAELSLPVYIISGNHDSAQRIAVDCGDALVRALHRPGACRALRCGHSKLRFFAHAQKVLFQF